MSTGLPSLDLLLRLVQAERDKQLQHFDALDAKAGVIVGFTGVLVALAASEPGWIVAAGMGAGMLSGGFALAAFWPRAHPVLEPSPLRRYLAAEEAFTKLTVLDTLEAMVNQTSRLLQRKAFRLRISLAALAMAVALIGLGTIL